MALKATHKNVITGVVSISAGILAGYFLFRNEYTKLSKSEIIDQLMRMDDIYIKLGSQAGKPTKADYEKYSKIALIQMLSDNIKSTSIGK